MRWPWQRRETRDDGGTYTALINQLIQAQAAGATTDASSTAALEAASGLLSRALASAEVVGPDWAREAVSPRCLAQIGRDLVRVGESLHVIRMTGGRLHLVPCSTWYLEGDTDPATWLATCTAYGPSGSTTWRLPWSSVIFVAWGSPTARPYHGLSPVSWASTTARLQGAAEKSLADEAGGPVAQLLPVPQDGGDGEDDDPLASLKSDITAAKGKAVLVETTAAGWGEGRTAAPTKDWVPTRLGPAPAGTMATIRKDAFEAVLAACGCSPALVDGSDGTSKREAWRQLFLGTVQPLARMLESELTEKLNVGVELRFDAYNFDLAGRAQAFQKLAQGGMAVNEALAVSGLLADDG